MRDDWEIMGADALYRQKIGFMASNFGNLCQVMHFGGPAPPVTCRSSRWFIPSASDAQDHVSHHFSLCMLEGSWQVTHPAAPSLSPVTEGHWVTLRTAA